LIREAKAERRALANQAARATPDVGDNDSFGRNVHFLGVAQTGLVSIQPDCTPDPNNPPLPDDRCFVPQPTPATTVIQARNIGLIKLPARATNSILCHSLTSLPLWHFSNPTANPGLAAFRYSTFMTIESEVLNDPNLIDPGTGLPFNGSFETGFSQITDTQTCQPGEQATRRNNTTRACIGGLVNKASLVQDFGLTAAQADDFFKKPITIHLHIQLATAFVDSALVLYGLRLFGD